MAKKPTIKELRRDIRAFNKINRRYGPTKALRAIEKHYDKHPWLGEEEKTEWSELLIEISKLVARFMKTNVKDRKMRIKERHIPRGTMYIKD